MLFLNTDIFVVYLTQTDTAAARDARKLFTALEAGSGKLTTSSLVLFQVITVLHNASGYLILKEPIVDALTLLLSQRNFRMEDKQVMVDALELWGRKPIEFIDAYNQVLMRARGATLLPD